MQFDEDIDKYSDNPTDDELTVSLDDIAEDDEESAVTNEKDIDLKRIFEKSGKRTFSISLSVISRILPILDGKLLKNHIWATGEASSICPNLSLLTFEDMTSTPHFSQTMPRCFILLYLPQLHS